MRLPSTESPSDSQCWDDPSLNTPRWVTGLWKRVVNKERSCMEKNKHQGLRSGCAEMPSSSCCQQCVWHIHTRQRGRGGFDPCLIDANDISPMAVAFLTPHPGRSQAHSASVLMWKNIFWVKLNDARCLLWVPSLEAWSELSLCFPAVGNSSWECTRYLLVTPAQLHIQVLMDDIDPVMVGDSNICEWGCQPSRVLWTVVFVCVAWKPRSGIRSVTDTNLKHCTLHGGVIYLCCFCPACQEKPLHLPVKTVHQKWKEE